MYALAVADFLTLQQTGPAKSTPITMKGVDSSALKAGTAAVVVREVDTGFFQ